jgi:hypothetical protein
MRPASFGSEYGEMLVQPLQPDKDHSEKSGFTSRATRQFLLRGSTPSSFIVPRFDYHCDEPLPNEQECSLSFGGQW